MCCFRRCFNWGKKQTSVTVPLPSLPASITPSSPDPAGFHNFAVTGDDGSLPSLLTRTQDNIVAELQAKLKTSPGWNTASTNVFGGIAGGLLGMFSAFFKNLTGIDLEGDLEGILHTVDQWGSDLLGLLGDPTGLGTGHPSPQTDIAAVPIFGPIIKYILDLPGEFWTAVVTFVTDIFTGNPFGAFGAVTTFLQQVFGFGDNKGGAVGTAGTVGANITGIFSAPNGGTSLFDQLIGLVEKFISPGAAGRVSMLSDLGQLGANIVNGQYGGAAAALAHAVGLDKIVPLVQDAAGIVGQVANLISNPKQDIDNLFASLGLCKLRAEAVNTTTSIAMDVLGVVSTPTGAGGGSITSMLGQMAKNFVSGAGATQVNLPTPLGTVPLGSTPSLISDVIGFVSNPSGNSAGTITDQLWQQVWNKINCNGLTGQGFDLGQAVTGLLDNPSGNTRGGVITQVGNVLISAAGGVTTFPGQVLTGVFSVLENPSGNSKGSILSQIVFAVAQAGFQNQIDKLNSRLAA